MTDDDQNLVVRMVKRGQAIKRGPDYRFLVPSRHEESKRELALRRGTRGYGPVIVPPRPKHRPKSKCRQHKQVA